MLTDIIGTILAFVTIMLMLSLIVTSLVQFTQATLRLRGRNLLVGVSALIEQVHPVAAAIAPRGESSMLRPRSSRKLAAHVLNDPHVSPLQQTREPNALSRVLLGPPVSWVEPGDLAQALVETAAAHAGDQTTTVEAAPTTDNVQSTFQRIEPALSKRFQFIMRLCTVAWSLIIAIAFQVSTPQLLKSLPSADAKRAAILASVPALVSETKRQAVFAGGDFVDEALGQLSAKYPQYRDLFEEVSGDAESREAMLGELGAVLGPKPDRDQVLNDYALIIDSLSEQSAKTAVTDASRMIDALDAFGIKFWPQKQGFYFDAPPAKWYQTPHWAQILGVLITGILLSLGAPFWFQQLKNLAGLRDAMTPNSSKSEAKKGAS